MPREYTDTQGAAVHSMDVSLMLEAQYDKVFKSVFDAVEHKDYRDHPAGRRQKIDYLLVDSTGRKVFVDDKADKHLATSGNLSLELFTVSPTGIGWGWMVQGVPAWLRYGSTESPDLIGIPMRAAKEWIAARHREFPVVSVVNRKRAVFDAEGNRAFSHITYNLLVPIDMLLLALEDSWHLQVPEEVHQFPNPVIASEWVARMRSVTPAEALDRMLEGPAQIDFVPTYSRDVVRDIVSRDRKREQNMNYICQCKPPGYLEDLFRAPPVEELAMEADY